MADFRTKREQLRIEPLEAREMLSVSTTLDSGVLTVEGGPERARLEVVRDIATDEIVVRDAGRETARVPSAQVIRIAIRTGPGDDRIVVADEVTQPLDVDGVAGRNQIRAGGGPAVLLGGPGNDKLKAGPAGAELFGGPGRDQLIGGRGPDVFDGGQGADKIRNVSVIDQVLPDPDDQVMPSPLDGFMGLAAPQPAMQLTADEVELLLRRAAAASATTDAIIAVVDRNGRILGVRVEDGVAREIQDDADLLTFAIDGAVAKARTAAYFANQGAPLNSRTIQFISQSTITQREVESNPSITDPNSVDRGPGFVAPVGVGGHFPPRTANTPQVDLFAIEHTNRDSVVHPGPDGIKGTADDVTLPGRFNIDPSSLPSPEQRLDAPESYGLQSGLRPTAQGRGIATLPGGIPIYRDGVVLGGIGVFFPGTTGYATEENSELSLTHDPSKPDRSFEAEWIAFAAAGGVRAIVPEDRITADVFPVREINGVPDVPFGLPFGRIDLAGITLDIFGPGGSKGVERLVSFGVALGFGDPDSGVNLPVAPGPDGLAGTGDDVTFLSGRPAPEGWLVTPKDGDGLSAADVERIIMAGIAQAVRTRAAIRLPISTETRMIIAVTDKSGEVLGLFRMPDATYFSLDVAVAKARNVAYYADPVALQDIDQVPGVPKGTAFTNRTFRYLALPQLPEGIDGALPGPFSVLNDGGADPTFGLQVGPKLPASAFQSVLGFNAFNPMTNFRDPDNILNQNGIVFFPGSAPLYKDVNGDGIPELVGGLGVSGDGVDQDDVVTFAASREHGVPEFILRADEVTVRGVRIPYQKFNRNPEGGIVN